MIEGRGFLGLILARALKSSTRPLTAAEYQEVETWLDYILTVCKHRGFKITVEKVEAVEPESN